MIKKINKFIKLSNNQYLKIVFTYGKQCNIWGMDIVVGDTKRQCNDCLNKSSNSPKITYGKITGRGIGLEAIKLAKDELISFEKSITYDTTIKIIGASKRLCKVYSYLKRYGYNERYSNKNGIEKTIMYKKIIKR